MKLRSLPGRAVGAVLAFAVVFLAGAATGAALDRRLLLVNSDGWTNAKRQPDRLGTSDSSPEVRRALELGIPFPMVRLGLTAAQESTLAEIGRRRRPRADSVMRALRPVVSGMETQMMQEMLCALTPAQQQHWLVSMDTMKFEPTVVAERYRPIREHTCDKVGK